MVFYQIKSKETNNKVKRNRKKLEKKQKLIWNSCCEDKLRKEKRKIEKNRRKPY